MYPPNDRSSLKKYASISKSYGSTYPTNQSALDISLFSNVAQRLRFRRDLLEYRRVASNFSLLMGLFGILLAIFDNQVSLNLKYSEITNQYLISFIIRLCITLTTVILIALIFVYHNIDLKIEMQKYNMNDWKLVLNGRRIAKIVVEIIICSCQPFPVHYPLKLFGQGYVEQSLYDRIMTILIFLRLYLVARVLILRSSLHHNISAQSFGAMNQTIVNTKFIFKSWMTLYSIYILISLIMFIFIWGSFAMTVCEVSYSFYDSMWITAVTFLSIGYGDITPSTPCSKAVAVLIGALGAGCTALLVAIVSRKLELTQSEKYVHNFVQESQFKQKIRHCSANILKYSWMLYHLKKGNKRHCVILYERKLFYSIRLIREIRNQRRQLYDSGISMVEVSRTQIDSRALLDSLNDNVGDIESMLQLISKKLNCK